jgi:hypothetical protein
MKKLLVELDDKEHEKVKWYALKAGKTVKEVIQALIAKLKDYTKDDLWK